MYGSKILTQVSFPVEKNDPELKQLIADMRATLANIPTGVGLAAPQVGVLKRVFLGEDNKVFINPIITTFGKETKMGEEGCLSIPRIYAPVRRSKKVTVTWRDQRWAEHSEEFEGTLLNEGTPDEKETLEAIVIQHELDHLDGILFTEKTGDVYKQRMRADLQKFLKREMPYTVNYPVVFQEGNGD